jgi:hypothetical protein
MFKIKIFFEKNGFPKTLRRLLPWLLCLVTFFTLTDDAKNYTFAQSCSNLKFPLTLGFNSGETEIVSIDQDSATGNLYISGITTTTELKVSGATKSVFTALFNGLEYLWIKVINDPLVDTVEFMSAMGSSSLNLVLYATKSSSPYIPLIFTISKSDGSIVRVAEINNSSIGEINPPSK